MRLVANFLLAGAVAACAVAQGARVQNPEPAPPLSQQIVKVEKVPDFIPPFLAANIALPIQCSTEGVAYVRLASTQAVLGILSVSPDGKQARSFSADKVNDILDVRLGAFAPEGSGIDVLVRWIERPRKERATLIEPDGGKETAEMVRGEERNGIARFDADGSFAIEALTSDAAAAFLRRPVSGRWQKGDGLVFTAFVLMPG